MSEGLYPSALDALQHALAQQLSSCAALRGLSVLTREIGAVEDAIELQLATLGAAIFVSEVELGGISGDLPGVSADDAQFTVVIFVSPTTNGTGRSAAALREYVMRRLHLYTPGVEGAGVVTLVPDPENGRPTKTTNIRDLTFRLSFSLPEGIG
jgi:hypothetical protein